MAKGLLCAKKGGPVFRHMLFCGTAGNKSVVVRYSDSTLYVYSARPGTSTFLYQRVLEERIVDIRAGSTPADLCEPELLEVDLVVVFEARICWIGFNKDKMNLAREISVSDLEGIGPFQVFQTSKHVVVTPVRGFLSVYPNIDNSSQVYKYRLGGTFWHGLFVSKAKFVAIVYADVHPKFHVYILHVGSKVTVTQDLSYAGLPVSLLAGPSESFLICEESMDRYCLFRVDKEKYVYEYGGIQIATGSLSVELYSVDSSRLDHVNQQDHDPMFVATHTPWRNDRHILITERGSVICVSFGSDGHPKFELVCRTILRNCEQVINVADEWFLAADPHAKAPKVDLEDSNISPEYMWVRSVEADSEVQLVCKYHNETKILNLDLEAGRCKEIRDSRLDGIVDLIDMKDLVVVVTTNSLSVHVGTQTISSLDLGHIPLCCSATRELVALGHDGGVSMYRIRPKLEPSHNLKLIDMGMVTCLAIDQNRVFVAAPDEIAVYSASGDRLRIIPVLDTPNDMIIYYGRLVTCSRRGYLCSYDMNEWTMVSQRIGTGSLRFGGSKQRYLISNTDIYSLFPTHQDLFAGYKLGRVIANSPSTVCLLETRSSILFIHNNCLGIRRFESWITLPETNVVELDDQVHVVAENTSLNLVRGRQILCAIQLASRITRMAAHKDWICVCHGHEVTVCMLEEAEICPIDVVDVGYEISSMAVVDRNCSIILVVATWFGPIKTYRHYKSKGTTECIHVDSVHRSIVALEFFNGTVLGLEHCKQRGPNYTNVVQVDSFGTSSVVCSLDLIALGFCHDSFYLYPKCQFHYYRTDLHPTIYALWNPNHRLLTIPTTTSECYLLDIVPSFVWDLTRRFNIDLPCHLVFSNQKQEIDTRLDDAFLRCLLYNVELLMVQV